MVNDRPKPGCPLPASGNLGPVAGHPLPVGRRRPPETAYPDVVGSFVIPAPIAGNPLHIALGLLIGWHFLDYFGRLLGNDRSRLRLSRNRFSVGFMHRAAREDVDAFLGRIIRPCCLISLLCASRFLSADCTRTDHQSADSQNADQYRPKSLACHVNTPLLQAPAYRPMSHPKTRQLWTNLRPAEEDGAKCVPGAGSGQEFLGEEWC